MHDTGIAACRGSSQKSETCGDGHTQPAAEARDRDRERERFPASITWCAAVVFVFGCWLLCERVIKWIGQCENSDIKRGSYCRLKGQGSYGVWVRVVCITY